MTREAIRRTATLVCFGVALAAAAAGGVGEWTFRGPTVTYAYDLAIDARDPSTVYASTDGGLLRTTDAGQTWSVVDGLGFATLLEVEADPQDPSNVYAVTGLPDGGGCRLAKSFDGGRSWDPIYATFGRGDCLVSDLTVASLDPATLYVTIEYQPGGCDDCSFDGSIFKSDDAGRTWTDVRNGLPGIDFRTVAVDANDSSRVYTAAGVGVWRSDDGGASWSQVLSQVEVSSLVIDPRDSAIYAGSRSGIYKSDDGGFTWRTSQQAGLNTSVLAIDPAHPDVVYAGTRNAGIYKSGDGAITWSAIATGAGRRQVRALAVHPVDSSIVYAGTFGDGILRSDDSGETWAFLDSGSRLRAEVLAQAIGKRFATTFYAGTRRFGIYKSDDEGRTWYPSSSGLETNAPVTALVIDPRQPSIVYAGTDDGGVWRSLNGGRSWSFAGRPPGFEIRSLTLDPNEPRNVYAVTDQGLYESRDGGEWTQKCTYYVMALAVSSGSTLPTFYVGNSDGVYKSTDQGSTWLWSGYGLPNTGVESLAVHPRLPDVVYAGTRQGIYKSTNGGDSWRDVSRGLGDPRAAWISDLVVDPREPSHLYGLHLHGQLFESLDAGSSWNAVGTRNSFPGSLTIHPWSPSTVYVRGYELMRPRCGDTALCFDQERFALELVWRDGRGRAGLGRMAPASSDDSGVMWFFGEDNWEMLVKVLDGCRVNDRFWVFAAATTDVEYGLRVTDTLSGSVKSYFNPSGTRAAALTDTQAFATCDDTAPSDSVVWQLLESGSVVPVDVKAAPASRSAASGGCAGTPKGLCLQEDRFLVEVRWQDSAGKTGSGQAVPFRSDDSGLMWFFGEDNWEMLVKVLDGCDVNDRFWVFAAATTNVGYTLKVTDTRSGEVRRYRNPLGRAAAALTDTSAFATCSE